MTCRPLLLACAGWASAAGAQLQSITLDYPPASLLKGEQGVVGYSVEIDPAGKVRRCAVTASSGFPRLDKATCASLKASARFKPAVDAAGKAVPSSLDGTMRWTTGRTPGP